MTCSPPRAAPPLAWLTGRRIALAYRLLETGGAGVEAVARHSGLGSAANLRGLLRRHVGLSPAQYRRRFPAPAQPVG